MNNSVFYSFLGIRSQELVIENDRIQSPTTSPLPTTPLPSLNNIYHHLPSALTESTERQPGILPINFSVMANTAFYGLHPTGPAASLIPSFYMQNLILQYQKLLANYQTTPLSY